MDNDYGVPALMILQENLLLGQHHSLRIGTWDTISFVERIIDRNKILIKNLLVPTKQFLETIAKFINPRSMKWLAKAW
jgi:hypothetical protein